MKNVLKKKERSSERFSFVVFSVTVGFNRVQHTVQDI